VLRLHLSYAKDGYDFSSLQGEAEEESHLKSASPFSYGYSML